MNFDPHFANVQAREWKCKLEEWQNVHSDNYILTNDQATDTKKKLNPPPPNDPYLSSPSTTLVPPHCSGLVASNSQGLYCVAEQPLGSCWPVDTWKGWFGAKFDFSLRLEGTESSLKPCMNEDVDEEVGEIFVFGSSVRIQRPYLMWVLANLLFDLVNMFACIIKESSCSNFA